MRLIYVDNINFHCNYNGDCTGDIEDCKECENYICDFRDIQEQPTAYDIDKVVEELESEKRYGSKYDSYYEENLYRGEMFENDVNNKTINKAIEIVKQGGVADDVCEYKIKDKVIYASCNNKQIASAFCWFNECGDYKYCPYCSKNIKVVE